MMAKITKGTSFSTLVNYILDDKKDAKLLGGLGLLLMPNNKDLIIDGFNAQAQLNPRVSKPVGHISLSFHQEDINKLTYPFLRDIALEYLERMGIENTQFLIAQHFDKEHPHIHIAYNRINNDGKTISDKHDRYRSEKICKELTRIFELYFSKGKENVKVERLRGYDKTKYEIYDALKELVPQCKNWKEFQRELNKKGITIGVKYKGKTKDIQGILFYKNDARFTGSQIDRQFSYSKIEYQLSLNRFKEQLQQSRLVSPSYVPTFGKVVSILDELFPSSYIPPVEDEVARQERLKRKRKKGLRR